MGTIVKVPENKEFAPAPEGLHRAICVDVLDSWTEERPAEFGGGLVEKTRLVWEIDAAMEDGRPFQVSQFYTFSLHEKANLRKHLESWRGRAFTDAELRGFDLEAVVGVPCQLQVIHHTTRTNKTYANVAGIVPPAKGTPPLKASGDYVRMKDRKEEPGTDEDYSAGDETPF